MKLNDFLDKIDFGCFGLGLLIFTPTGECVIIDELSREYFEKFAPERLVAKLNHLTCQEQYKKLQEMDLSIENITSGCYYLDFVVIHTTK